MGLEVAHGVGRQESVGDLRSRSCAIQDRDRTCDVGTGVVPGLRYSVISFSINERKVLKVLL